VLRVKGIYCFLNAAYFPKYRFPKWLVCKTGHSDQWHSLSHYNRSIHLYNSIRRPVNAVFKLLATKTPNDADEKDDDDDDTLMTFGWQRLQSGRTWLRPAHRHRISELGNRRHAGAGGSLFTQQKPTNIASNVVIGSVLGC